MVMFVLLMYHNVAESYQPRARSHHSTVLIEDKLYTWGGGHPDLPEVHSSAEKEAFTSFVDVFHRRLGV